MEFTCKFKNTGDAMITWANVAIPYDSNHPERMIFLTENGIQPIKSPAIKLPTDVGTQSTIYSVYRFFNKEETVEGKLVSLEKGDESLFTDVGFDIFKVSDWVGSDLWSKLPMFFVNDQSLPFNSNVANSQILEISPARVVLKACFGPVQGCIVNFYAYIYNQQDYIPFSLSFHWSDRNDPTYGPKEVTLGIKSKNAFMIENSYEMGLSPTSYESDSELWSVNLLSNKSFRDGQGAYWYGNILCLPDDFMSSDQFNDPNTQTRLTILNSCRTGSVEGLFMNWSDL
jgi:hypothetical protein